MVLRCKMLALRYVGSLAITGHISHPPEETYLLGLGRDGQDPRG